MKKNITVLCSNLKGNLGDFAIAEAVATAAQKRYGDCVINLYYHANKRVDAPRLEAMLEETSVEYQTIKAAPYFRRPVWLRWLRRLGVSDRCYSKWHNRQIEKVARLIQMDDEFFTTAISSDAVIFAGGAQWGRGDLNLNMFAQLLAVGSRRNDVFAFPFSVSDALVSCNGRAEVKQLFTHLAQPIYVRDGISHSCLQACEVESELVFDCVFSLSHQFQTSWDLDALKDEYSGRVYLSLTQSGVSSPQSVAKMIESIQVKSLTPVLFSSCEVEDRPFYESIQALCEVEALYPASWKQAVDTLSKCRFVITNRLHCLIFSALSGTPVVPVTNRSKTKAYVKDADLPCSMSQVEPLGLQQFEKIERELLNISSKQNAYAKACAELLEDRLGKIFPNSHIEE